MKDCPKKSSFREESFSETKCAECVQNYKNTSKAQKRWAVERLIKYSNSYENVRRVEKFAQGISYSLTKRQTEKIIEKLVYAAQNSLQLEEVREYANSKNLLNRYVKAKLSKKISENS